MPSFKKPDAAASIFGAGAGTGLIGLLNFVPDAYVAWQAILVYFAPAFSVCVSIVWLMLGEWFRKQKLSTGVKQLRRQRDQLFKDPNASDAHKAQVQKNLEMTERLLNDLICDEARIAGVWLANGRSEPQQ